MKLRTIVLTNDFAKQLYANICDRGKKLLKDNDAMLSALYMDPRYNFRGSAFMTLEMKTRAQVRLKYIH